LDPLILGLSATILYLVSSIDRTAALSLELAVALLLLGVLLAILIAARRLLAPNTKG